MIAVTGQCGQWSVLVHIDATTAEKLEGTSRAVYADPLPFHPQSLPRLSLIVIACFSVSPITFPTLLSFSPRLNFTKEVCFPQHLTTTKWQPVAKAGGDQIQLVLMISKVGGDASHGSHRMVAPMQVQCVQARV